MRLDPRRLRDVLVVEVLTPAPLDPLTDTPTGPASTREVTRQPCSDQDTVFRARTAAIVNGVPGALPVSLCYTAWFPWPPVQAGESVVVRVNSRYRPLMKAGPPVDVAGQGEVYQIELGPPEGER